METYSGRDAILLSMGYTSYQQYLVSPLWISIRARAREAHGTKCRLCQSIAVVMHHTTYCQDVLLGLDLGGLVPLCDRCHYKVEFDNKDKKRSVESARATFNKLASRTRKKGRRCNACGNKISKYSDTCRACRGTGITGWPTSKKAAAYLRSQGKQPPQ